jgi:hypothetical protein
MKILIRENKRDRLAKQELEKEFSGMYEDVNYTTDSRGEHKRIEYRNGDGVIMIYGDTDKILYICEDVVSPISYFGYDDREINNIVGEWFSEFFELPIHKVRQVDKGLLN